MALALIKELALPIEDKGHVAVGLLTTSQLEELGFTGATLKGTSGRSLCAVHIADGTPVSFVQIEPDPSDYDGERINSERRTQRAAKILNLI